LSKEALIARLDELSPRELEAVDRLLNREDLPHFNDIWRSTANYQLDSWQENVLGPICHRFAWESGVREAIHAPPQVGKSVAVSQRLPAYCIGVAPENTRVALACFNIQRARDFGDIVSGLMKESAFVRAFGERAAIPRNAGSEEFTTAARAALRDAQPSFAAYGLRTGITGRGATHIIIDDPYPSAEMAQSKAYNEMVWRVLNQTILARVPPETNILLMYHRYHPDDLAGRAIQSGLFKQTRLPMVMDENEDGSDRTGRAIGELLSPRVKQSFVDGIRDRDPFTFQGQLQGRPEPPGGTLIRREWLRPIPERLVPFRQIPLWVRFWDLAVKKDQERDFTAGALIGVGPNQEIYLKDVAHFREQWPRAQELILQVTAKDALWAQRQGCDYWVGIEEVFWQLPMIQDLMGQKLFKGGVQLQPVEPMGDKKTRASGWIARAKYGGFYVIQPENLGRDGWDIEGFISEATSFNGLGLSHDDQVDGVSGAYSLTWTLRGGLQEEELPPQAGSHEYYEQLTKQHTDENSEFAYWE
jgi:predicted phage terminase large subunit-like protein